MPRKGENITKRKDGRWEARYIHHYENGRAKYRFIYGKSYTEAKAKRMQELNDLYMEKTFPPKYGATFGDISSLWLSEVKNRIKESSYTRYYRCVKQYLFPLFEKTVIYKLDGMTVNQLIIRLQAMGGVNNAPLSSKTVSDAVCILKEIFIYGKNQGYPCPDIKNIRHPKTIVNSREIMSEHDIDCLEKHILTSEEPAAFGILFALYTGVRIGELCGLRWGDIDFLRKTVSITRTIERISDLSGNGKSKTKVIVSEPKTQNSRRVIPLPDFLMQYLTSKRRSDNIYILTGTQNYAEPATFYSRYRTYMKHLGIDMYSFHSLRHTFATRCVEAGFDIKSLSEILGHSNVTTTLKCYVHPTLEQKRIQMQRLTPELFRSQIPSQTILKDKMSTD